MISSCFDSVEGSAEDLTLFASSLFFPSRSDEGAGSISRGRVFEGNLRPCASAVHRAH